MKLFEYQARELLDQYGIPVTGGELALNPDDVRSIVSRMGTGAVIKAQVLSGGRGKAGGVKIARDPDQAFAYARDIFGLTIGGYPVTKVFVAHPVEITKELYLSIVVNRNIKSAEIVFSESGGMEIEEVADTNPEEIKRIRIDPLLGPNHNGIVEILAYRKPNADIDEFLAVRIADITTKLYALLIEKDCSLVEINPLAITPEKNLVAIDAKITLDDNGLFRHPELESYRNSDEYSDDENDARNAHLAFVGLDGDIGCMVNGAGLSMATMDLIKLAGGKPANFLDIGGSSNPQKVIDAISIIMRNRKVQAILINIFGGITRCDDIANGIVLARPHMICRLPLVIRLIGTNDAEGKRILKTAGFDAYTDLNEAVERVVGIVRDGKGGCREEEKA